MATPQEHALDGVVVGLKALTGEVKARVDIDVLLTQHPDTFNLMLQAISQLQKDPKKLGFYAIAGIHGLPTEAWDDVWNKWDNTFGGYCAHGVLTFPTWHRPYLALFEQTIYLKMVEIANSYNPQYRQKYMAACKDFRLPYLDYFRPRGGNVLFPGVGGDPKTDQTSFSYDFRLPDIFNVKKITVRAAPDDTPDDNFDNPLYTYKFSEKTGQLPEKDQESIASIYSLKQTLRYPASRDTDTHNLAAQSNALNSGREGRTALTMKLLNSTPYQLLSTVASDRLEQGDLTNAPGLVQANASNPRGNGSLEGSVHGNYHILIGGQRWAHMSDPTVAAFDPVFWFHHCNIDRYWALWSAMHPKSWFPQPTSADQKPENQKDLLPFYKSRTGPGNGTFYNSDDSKTTEAFGYFYDDFENTTDTTTLWTKFTSKYDWSIRTPQHPQFTDPPKNMTPLNAQTTQFFQKASKQAKAVTETASFATSSIAAAVEPVALHAQAILKEVTPSALKAAPAKIDDKFDREWYVDSSVLRSASNGTFTIFFFLAKAGELHEDVASFEQSPYLAGLNHIFTAPREQCDNCGNLEAAGQLATDTTLITPLLLDYLELPGSSLQSLRPEHVKPFLIEHLRWRVVYHDNSIRDARQVPDLKVNVSAELYHEDGSKTYEDYPDVIETILHNASETPTAAAS